MVAVRELKRKLLRVWPHLNERSRRMLAAAERYTQFTLALWRSRIFAFCIWTLFGPIGSRISHHYGWMTLSISQM